MTYTQKNDRKRIKIEKTVCRRLNIDRWELEIPDFSAEGDGIGYFRALFDLGGPDGRTVLWNTLTRYTDYDGIDKDRFSEDEYRFILQRKASFDTPHLDESNGNRAFRTERLILKPADGDGDLKKYRKHLKEDGDFTLYTCLKPSAENVRHFNLSRPLCFVVCEKTTGEAVGEVGLKYDEDRRMADASWYVFKQFRKKGYAEEAVTALAARAFSGKLFEWREQVRADTYKRHYAKIELIRAEIRVSNTASRRLAAACGFKEKYVDRRHFVVEGEGLEDAVIMELEPGDIG